MKEKERSVASSHPTLVLLIQNPAAKVFSISCHWDQASPFFCMFRLFVLIFFEQLCPLPASQLLFLLAAQILPKPPS